jgi:hypothetical protein
VGSPVTVEQFFDDIPVADAPGLQRDRWGRPLLVPRGQPKTVRAPYTRASGLSDFVTNDRGIQIWERRYLIRGMGANEDLQELAACESYNTGLIGPGEPAEDTRENKASGRRLDEIGERALERMKIHEKADYGTAVHMATEPGSRAIPSKRMRGDVASFAPTLEAEGIHILQTEAFVANDTVMSAGTFDHLLWVPGYGVIIGDKKTGKMNPYEFGIQFSTYANGDAYDVYTDERTQIHPDLNPEWGMVIWMPALQGKTILKMIDLRLGYQDAIRAAEVRDAQKDRSLRDAPPGFFRKRRAALLHTALLDAPDMATLYQLRRDHKDIWSEEYSAVARIRQGELT